MNRRDRLKKNNEILKEVKDGIFQGNIEDEYLSSGTRGEKKRYGERKRQYMNTADAVKLIDDPVNEDHVNRRAEELKKPGANAKMTSVTVDPKGRISHMEGRHELHAMHRAGVKTVPIQIREYSRREHPKRLSNIDLTNRNLLSERLGRDYERSSTFHRRLNHKYGYGGEKEWESDKKEREEKIRQGMESLKSWVSKKVKDGVFQERFVPAIQPSDPRPPEYDKTISESDVWHNRAESTPKGMKIPYKAREGRGPTKHEDDIYTGRGTGKIHHVDPTKFSMRIARPMDKKHIGRRARQMKEETNRTARIPDIQVSRGKDGKLHLHHEDGRHELHAAARAGIKTMPIRLTPGSNIDNVKDIDPTDPKHVRAEDGSGEYIHNKRRYKKIYGYGGKREPKRSRSEREEKIREGMESLKSWVSKKVKDGLYQERFVPSWQSSNNGKPKDDQTISDSNNYHTIRNSTPKGMKIPFKHNPTSSLKEEEELYTGRGTGKIHYVDPTKFSHRIARPEVESHVKRRANQMKEESTTARIPDIKVNRDQFGNHQLQHQEGRHELHAAARAGIRNMPIRLIAGEGVDNVKDIEPSSIHVKPEENSREHVNTQRYVRRRFGYGGEDESTGDKKRREESIRQGMESLKSIEKNMDILKFSIRDLASRAIGRKKLDPTKAPSAEGAAPDIDVTNNPNPTDPNTVNANYQKFSNTSTRGFLHGKPPVKKTPKGKVSRQKKPTPRPQRFRQWHRVGSRVGGKPTNPFKFHRKDGAGYGNLGVSTITPKTTVVDNTYIGKPIKDPKKLLDLQVNPKKQETYIGNNSKKKKA